MYSLTCNTDIICLLRLSFFARSYVSKSFIFSSFLHILKFALVQMRVARYLLMTK